MKNYFFYKLCLVFGLIVGPSFLGAKKRANQTVESLSKLPEAAHRYIPGKPVYLSSFAKTNNVTKEQFDKVINDVAELYCPIIEERDGICAFSGNWKETMINAFAMRLKGEWRVIIFGGLARHPLLTLDGLAAVVCHEVGHHLAGFSNKASVLGDSWAATEGQSDYFAAHRCLPKLWENDLKENAAFRNTVDPLAKSECDRVWESKEKQNLCYRITMAGKSDTAMIADATNKGPIPQFENETTAAVNTTSDAHPLPQCRLDTQFSAALCKKEFDDSVIPGDLEGYSNRSIEAEVHSTEYTCHTADGYVTGSRPSCWFKPRLEFSSLKIGAWRIEEVSGNGNGHWEPGETASVSYELRNDSPAISTTNISVSLKHNISGKWTRFSNLYAVDEISPNSAIRSRTLKVRLPESAKCGSLVHMKAFANSDQGEASSYHNIAIGKLKIKDLGKKDENTEVNGKEYIYDSVLSTHTTDLIDRAKVEVSFRHKWPNEVKAWLKDPSGKRHVLNFDDMEGKDVTKAFDIPIDQEFSESEWTLEINNRSQYQTLLLKNWKLKLQSSKCE